jgi:uncharacterized protein YukE
MAGRVLSSPEAKQAITKLQALINTELVKQITDINKEGTTLSQSDVWDGQLAQQFRENWPKVKSDLDKVKADLEDLRAKVQQINQNIMTAGGNQ